MLVNPKAIKQQYTSYCCWHVSRVLLMKTTLSHGNWVDERFGLPRPRARLSTSAQETEMSARTCLPVTSSPRTLLRKIPRISFRSQGSGIKRRKMLAAGLASFRHLVVRDVDVQRKWPRLESGRASHGPGTCDCVGGRATLFSISFSNPHKRD